MLIVKKLRVFYVLMCTLFCGAITSAVGQNLIPNWNFEAGDTGFQSDYTYYEAGVHPLSDPGVYIVKRNPHDYHPTQFFDMGDHTSGTGKFFIANGKGLLSSYRVWTTTVNVTPNTTYSFTFWATHISNGNGSANARAMFRVTINGTIVGTDNWQPQFVSGGYWDQYPAATWNSGTATSATIIIYDRCPMSSGFGDDFGIDDISFVPDVTYSVDAVDDTGIQACQGTAVDIDVLNNDVITPNANDATVSIVSQPSHGTATVLSNNKIRYTFTGGNYTTDQLKYRVTTHGVYDEAWVFIETSRQPTVGNISTPDAICDGGALGIDLPSVTPDADGNWQCCQTHDGTFVNFDPNNIPMSMNGWWVRYSASNDCGEGHSNAVQITVADGPTITGQTPQIQPICADGSLNLTPPAYSANGSPILSQGWVAAPTENGEYQSFNLNNISASYNGWYIRYMVESSCGVVYSNPARQLVVNVAPSITGTLQAPPAICAGDDLNVVAPTYDGNGTGVWEICQTQGDTYQSFSIQNVPATYNNWYLHYKVSNDCGNDVSNVVQIHVYDAPTIPTPNTPQAICAGNSFSLTTPSVQNNGSTITNQGWQIAATQGGTYNAFNNSNIPYEYNGYWIRYFAENDCGMTYSPAVQITVNDIPVVGDIIAPVAICAGGSFALTTPQVQWRHTNQGTGSWEIAPTSSGDFTALNNNNIPYAYNGYYLRYKAVNGCGTSYSSNVVQVTVYSTDPTYDTITACDTYVWNGISCNHTGDFQAQVQSPNGCDITAHLHFIMSDAYTETQTYPDECESFTWYKNGQTYYSSGVYEYAVESGDPLVCDSIFTLNLTINNAPEIMGSIEAPSAVCAGSAMPVNAPQYAMNHVNGGDAHWEYATAASGPWTPFDPSTGGLGYGSYYLRFAVTNGCGEAFSNVVAFHVDDVPEAIVQLSALQVCEGQPLDLPEVNVIWNNEDENDRLAQWQMASTQIGPYANIDPTMLMQTSHNGYYLRFVAHNSCGDDIVGPVPITVIAEVDEWLETITACDAYTLPSGEVVTESRVVEYVTYDPCYHIIHQPIVINYSDYVVEPITSCHESFEWHGMTFYHSDETQYAAVTLTNAQGCDSLVELQLDFGEYATYTHNRIACGSYVWEMNPDYTYTESVRDSVFVPAVDETDCDTWYFLELTLGHDTLVDGGAMTECSGFVWHGIPYYNDAILYDSLQTAVTHCDSIIAYRLTIVEPIEKDTTIVSCQPIWWQEHYCEDDGDYQHVFSSVIGCDSIVTMHFSLADQIFREFDTLVCGPFNWYGTECNYSGFIGEHVFQTPQGCDSLVRMHVYMNEMVTSTQFIQACDHYEYEGTVYDQPGDYYIYLDTLFSQAGCDSIVRRIRLEILSSESIGAINGSSTVYVASNIISGIYRYEIDTTGLASAVVWTLSNPDWQIVEAADNYCRIFVGTPGSATLKANFRVADCGEMERSFDINAGFFAVDDRQGVEVRIYPNPTQATVTIESEGIERVRVIDMMGQTLAVREVGRQDQVTLDLGAYAPSVYLLEVETVNGMAKKRVVVCR